MISWNTIHVGIPLCHMAPHCIALQYIAIWYTSVDYISSHCKLFDDDSTREITLHYMPLYHKPLRYLVLCHIILHDNRIMHLMTLYYLTYHSGTLACIALHRIRLDCIVSDRSTQHSMAIFYIPQPTRHCIAYPHSYVLLHSQRLRILTSALRT